MTPNCAAMNLHVGDCVLVIRGPNKGKIGTLVETQLSWMIRVSTYEHYAWGSRIEDLELASAVDRLGWLAE